MAQSGPRKSGAELAYEAFNEKYPEEIRTKWDKIFTTKDEEEKQAALLLLSDEQRNQYDIYIVDLLAFEKEFYQKIIVEPVTAKPILYRTEKPDSSSSDSDNDAKPEPKFKDDNLKSFSY